MITNIKLVGVCVSDQQQALDFYTGKLGFTLVADIPMGPGLRWIEVSPPGAQTHLALFTPEGLEDRIGTFSNIVFRCKDIDETCKSLRARGVVLTKEPEAQPGGIMAQIADEDGNEFVLRESP